MKRLSSIYFHGIRPQQKGTGKDVLLPGWNIQDPAGETVQITEAEMDTGFFMLRSPIFYDSWLYARQILDIYTEVIRAKHILR